MKNNVKRIFLVGLICLLSIPMVAQAAETYTSRSGKKFTGWYYLKQPNTHDGVYYGKARSSRFNLNSYEGINRYESEVYFIENGKQLIGFDYGATWAEVSREVPPTKTNRIVIRAQDSSGWKSYAQKGWTTITYNGYYNQ